MSRIRENIARVKETLLEGVTLIAVSKTKSPEEIMEAYAMGIRDFGENKVQEIEAKYDVLPKDIRWHLIGHLQTNKVRKVLGKTHLIQSLDRESLAVEINKRAEKMNLMVDTLIEVNIGEEEQKAGILLKDLPEFLELLRNLDRIHVRGLMAIIPQGSLEENRYYFRKMKEVFTDLKKNESERFTMEILSMGMSSDYEAAMLEGSTMVRVGTGIFGSRNY
ncbi:YggS family pyridoxal phosphate-dependent enzyme [Proteiniclasticum sp. C24MP]|uniref:YggS family pyridoxal phosphate-dependent enzyme n=1 Tax=Proteiniclasticum sp. C24MP TaxID=3374101 RepID=UPI0037541A3B